MLRSIKELMKLPMESLDGGIGKAKDCLFDEQHWAMRYLVVDTGNWLIGKKVLISPLHLLKPAQELNWLRETLPINLSKAQIKACPPIDSDAPVSRKYEDEYARYYHHDVYWIGPNVWGMTHYPVYHSPTPIEQEEESSVQAVEDHVKRIDEIEHNSLRSSKEVLGYHISAKDDEFGHIEDFIIDDDQWQLRYFTIDSRNWWPGRKFLIDIEWIANFNWRKKIVSVDLSKKQIESSPEFDFQLPLDKEQVDQLYDHYGKKRRGDSANVFASK